MTTKELNRLRQRVKLLSNRLLPRKINVTGVYSAKAQDRALGFRILCHAEMEQYLEDIAITITMAAHARWTTTGRSSRALLSLAAHYSTGISHSDKTKTQDRILKFDNSVLDFVARHRREIKENHGLKEKNILSLFLPLGFNASQLDPSWMQGLSNFGTSRGEAAHRTGDPKVTQNSVNPFDELKTIHQLLPGFDAFDSTVRSYIKAI